MALASRWVSVAGLRMHALVSVERAAEPETHVVLVHGLGVSHRYFVPAAKALAPWFRVSVPDLPGFGESQGPREALDVERLADALAAWLETSRGKRAVLVGNSFGCQIVVDLAVRYPELAGAAVLIGPTVEAGARGAARQIGRLFRTGFSEPFRLWLLVASDYVRTGPRRLFATLDHALADRIEDKLPLVGVRVLVVRGEHDVLAPERWAERVAELAPHGQLMIVAGAGHAAHYTAPEELARAIRSFLRVEEVEHGAVEGTGPLQHRHVTGAVEHDDR